MSSFRGHTARVSDPYLDQQRIDLDLQYDAEVEEQQVQIPRQTLRDRENPLESIQREDEFRLV